MQKIWNNLVDGIRRFCRENNFSDAALGLSGGLDSAITAVAAAEALGGDHVHALMMKTRYTSDLSLEIAAEIAELNGLDYKDLIANAYRLLQDEDIRRVWHEKYRYIMIDEMQDTSIFEYIMLQYLFYNPF